MAPSLVLDNAAALPLSHNPVLAWRAWPVIFNQKVLLDYAVLTNGRSLAQVQPTARLSWVTPLRAARRTGSPSRPPLTQRLRRFRGAGNPGQQLLVLKAYYATLPAGRIACCR